MRRYRTAWCGPAAARGWMGDIRRLAWGGRPVEGVGSLADIFRVPAAMDQPCTLSSRVVLRVREIAALFALALVAVVVRGAATEQPRLVAASELGALPFAVTGGVRVDSVPAANGSVRVMNGSASVVNHPLVAVSVAHVFWLDDASGWGAQAWYRARERWTSAAGADRGVPLRGWVAATGYQSSKRAAQDAVVAYAYEPLAGGLFGVSLPDREVAAGLSSGNRKVLAGFPVDASGRLVAEMSQLGPTREAFYAAWPAPSLEWLVWGLAPRSGMSGGGCWVETPVGWRFAGMVTAVATGSDGRGGAAVHPFAGETARLLEDATFALVPNGDFWRSMSRRGDGWRGGSWLGEVNTQFLPWVWIEGLGWACVPGGGDDDLWMYLPDLGWVWTTAKVFPAVWRKADQRWRHFRVAGPEGAWVFDYGAQTWAWRPAGVRADVTGAG